MKKWLTLLIVLLLTTLAYSNILSNEFVWDDSDFILKWEAIRTFDLPAYLQGASPESHEGTWRPLRTIFYFISYSLFQTNPLPYHLQAILLHLTVTTLVYILTRQITYNRTLSFATALLFGVHPVHTESVTFTTGSFDLFGPLFFFSSIILFVKSIQRPNSLIYASSIVLAGLTFLSYEFTLILPLILVAVYFVVDREVVWREVIKRTAPYFALIAVYLIARLALLQVIPRNNPLTDSILLPWPFLLTGLTHHVLRLFYPSVLSTDPRIVPQTEEAILNAFATVTSIVTNVGVVFAVAVLIVSFFSAVYLRKRHPLVTFSIVWFFIAYLPFSNIIPTTASLAERYLYIPSYGWSLLIAYSGLMFHKRIIKQTKIPAAKFIIPTAFIILVLLFMVRTHLRNKDWNNDLALWTREVQNNPESFRAYFNLGTAYNNRGDFKEALQSLNTVLSMNPESYRVHEALGLVYLSQKEYEKAIESLTRALELNPNKRKIARLLSVAYEKKGDFTLATDPLQEFDQEELTADDYNRLGFLMLTSNRLEKAVEAYQKAIEVGPANPITYNNLAIVHLKAGNPEDAIDTLKQAVTLFPKDADLHYNLAQAYEEIDNPDGAKKEFEAVLQLKPNSPKIQEIIDNLN